MVSKEIIITIISTVVSPVILLFLKNRLEKPKKSDMIKDTLKVSEVITNKIEHIREELDADRVWIAQFHNGGHYYPTGKSIAKFSFIYETVSVGTPSIQTNFQNIPVNLFSKSINHLSENDNISIYDFKDETIPTYGLKYIAEDTSCKSGYYFAIKSLNDKFIGILGINYTKDKHQLTDEDIHHIIAQASSIGSVLIDSNYL